MYGRLGYLHLIHLMEANAQRRRLAKGAGGASHAVSERPQTRERQARTGVTDPSAFIRLAVVLGLALVAAVAARMAIG
jgi:hypothetical protein